MFQGSTALAFQFGANKRPFSYTQSDQMVFLNCEMYACSSQTELNVQLHPSRLSPMWFVLLVFAFARCPSAAPPLYGSIDGCPFSHAPVRSRISPVSTEPYGRPVQPVSNVSFCCVLFKKGASWAETDTARPSHGTNKTTLR